MMQHHDHNHYETATVAPTTKEGKNAWTLAFSATVHCLIGCGVGEVLGVIIGTGLDLRMWPTMLLGIALGFVFGFVFGILPLLRAGFGFRDAARTVLVAEGLSIAVMELFEVLTQIVMPGVMEAGLSDGIFWIGMAAALIIGFIAAFPVNLFLVKKGIRHRH